MLLGRCLTHPIHNELAWHTIGCCGEVWNVSNVPQYLIVLRETTSPIRWLKHIKFNDVRSVVLLLHVVENSAIPTRSSAFILVSSSRGVRDTKSSCHVYSLLKFKFITWLLRMHLIPRDHERIIGFLFGFLIWNHDFVWRCRKKIVVRYCAWEEIMPTPVCLNVGEKSLTGTFLVSTERILKFRGNWPVMTSDTTSSLELPISMVMSG